MPYMTLTPCKAKALITAMVCYQRGRLIDVSRWGSVKNLGVLAIELHPSMPYRAVTHYKAILKHETDWPTSLLNNHEDHPSLSPGSWISAYAPSRSNEPQTLTAQT